MELETLKKIIGLVFKKGKEDFPEATNKTQLADKIVASKPINNFLTAKSLLNYFNYFFFNIGKTPKPNEDNRDILLAYINFQSYKQFINNAPAIDYEVDVPYVIKNNDDLAEHNLDDNIKLDEPLEAKSSQPLYYFGIFGLITLVVIFVLSIIGMNNTSSSPITIHAKNFIVNDTNRIFPDKNTDFFKDNTAKVWYTHYNGETEFYNTYGIHPVTQEPLQPVTERIVKTYLVDRKEVSHVPLEKEVKTDIKTPDDLFNPSVINIPNSKELSLFVFDSIQNVDASMTNYLKQQLSTNYNITSNLILPNMLNEDVIKNLLSGNIKFLGAKINRHTDYVCIGKVRYSFRQNKILKDKITCELHLEYSILSTDTGQVIDSYSQMFMGNGSSKTNAQTNTLKKINL
ncbi:hypothetical protein H2O64_21635 [Kordia sp. YSTF-M3]|uniref:Uncharacterized protein n=1 Tax=Kordia aestuariivivens TaxID=2759037 RepID=A0ABR7QFE2_9FLAO|nr:hypothetical protein [Kordia aestuariivivens]MBC8757287.1 hypothetical protein [Kordia aestuariivivens]